MAHDRQGVLMDRALFQADADCLGEVITLMLYAAVLILILATCSPAVMCHVPCST